MAKAIFKVLLKFIKSVVDTILYPINQLVVNLLPDLSSMITVFNTSVSRFINSTLGFFSHLLPPYTRTLILVYLGFLVTYYTITITVHAVLKVIHIIKEVKIW